MGIGSFFHILHLASEGKVIATLLFFIHCLSNQSVECVLTKCCYMMRVWGVLCLKGSARWEGGGNQGIGGGIA